MVMQEACAIAGQPEFVAAMCVCGNAKCNLL